MSTEQAPETEVPRCPKCTGEMWDNRASKRNPRAPDFKCKDKSCEGVIWPPRDGERRPAASSTGGAAPRAAHSAAPAPPPDDRDFPGDPDDELPF